MEQNAPDKPVEVNLNMTSGASANVARKEVVMEKFVDYDLIIEDLQRLIELESNFEFAYYNLGIIYCQRRDFIKAEQMFNSAIDINGDFAEAYFNRGLVRLYLENDAEATVDLSKAGELGIFKAYNVIKRFGGAEKEKESN